MFDLSIIKDFAEEAFDDILDQLGVQCKLIYPPKWEACEDCIYDPIGKKSSNHYKNGGPIPFHSGACPMCNGAGKRQTENSDTIVMTIGWGDDKFSKDSNINTRIPLGGNIMCRSYLTEFNKIKQCDEMMILNELSGYGHFRFKLDGEPFDPFQITNGRYCISKWKRVG